MNAMAPSRSSRGSDWSEQEVQRTVTEYFNMLRSELLGQSYSKTDHRRRLLPLLDGRSESSIEFKHTNVSAVLVHMGLPYIDGYKPRGNYQALLAEHVEAFLEQHTDFFDQLAEAEVISPQAMPTVPDGAVQDFFERPPDRTRAPCEAKQPWVKRQGRRTDFPRRDAENRKLGRLGEEFALDLEQRRLREQGRDDLAEKVEWISETRGDGIGFDILSFDEKDDSERLVEVKTTGLGKYFPFYVSSNEVRCSEACPDQYHLYRLFQFSKSPRVYVLRGALSEACRLQPEQRSGGSFAVMSRESVIPPIPAQDASGACLVPTPVPRQ